MDNWLARVEPSRPFLITGERTWTYGESLAEISRRVSAAPVHVEPSLSPEGVFDVLSGVFGAGAIIGPVRGDPAGAALVVPTSGTTGAARGVRLTKANLEAAVIGSAAHLSMGPDDVWLLTLPLGHVGGLSILLRQIWTGGAVSLQGGFEPRAVWDALDSDVTLLSLVPTMLHRLLDTRGTASRLRLVLVGGGPIPEGLLDRAASRGLPVRPTYGMTETFGQVATLRPGAPLAHRVHPLPGVDIRIDDAGRIAVRGKQVSPGYLGELDRPDEWLTTNDLGEIDREGALRILGRADTVIVTGGEKVSPEVVESVLAGYPGLGEAVVTGVADSEWGQRVACAYVGEVDPGEVSGWLKERLPPHAVPKLWLRVDSIPRTSIGKPDRQAVSAALAHKSG